MKRWVVRIAVLTLLALGQQIPSSIAHAQLPRCFGRPATIIGTPGDDVLLGRPGSDVIVGLGGNDTVSGGRQIDYICGATEMTT
jgi:hypothetical protein